ncbi:MAG: hypothetical protein GXX96_17685 [Planctomycetaceae bacterium]|jgi:hypothetical protein|nr:hypothetical protein [Planctomycetaceae bacterium]
MKLAAKPDLAEVLARFEAWWECRPLDRSLVTIDVEPARPPKLPDKRHGSLRQRWMDADYVLDCVEARIESGVFLAETFPTYMPFLGPEVCATLFGAELKFKNEETSYSVPVARSVRDILGMTPDFSGQYWEKIRQLTDLSLERGRSRWITGVTDLHTNGDLLAALRDPQQLCLDCADDREGVRLACEHVTDWFAAVFDDLYDRIAAAGQPCTTWTPALAMAPWYTISCDFICMISPLTFREAILPSIRREMEHMKYNLFHLDGPGALKHLDALLELDDLDAIQWVYGAGAGPASRWIDVYRKIQNAGKSLQIVGYSGLDEFRQVAPHLTPAGLWLWPIGTYQQAEAEEFVRWVEEWGG